MAITGPECYSNALGILRELGQTHSTADGLAAAQVYATLALAAATALAAANGTERGAWVAVAGVPPDPSLGVPVGAFS